MTPLQFEAQHAAVWQELEAALAATTKRRRGAKAADRARIAALYRAACEHLAIAESRSYPVWLIERLEALTSRGHQLIYARADFGVDALRRLFLVDFPAAVRAHRLHVLIALVVFAGPLVAVGVLSYVDPGLVLSLHDANVVDQYEQMYGSDDGPIGRRTADSDWAMFGMYILNNIGIAFQCFAGGLFFGIGSLFFLALNGALAGSIAGYVTWRGFGENFYSFVITHGAFELTGIVLAGAAGLVLGHALLVPGRHSRLAALELAARRAIVIVYGMTAMFVVAAALEAFWSSARWVPAQVKIGVGAACWVAVIAYFVFQGRPRRGDSGRS
jgi:uncharacterized membrane protein SpoIIM required for sporulation